MRPEARIKSGFYPAPTEAIDHVLQYVCSPEEGKFSILDPCAGNGDAIHHIAQVLGCEMANVYAVELDHRRAAMVQKRIGEAGGNVLAPADYFGVSVPSTSLSFIWCNPPFDDEYGGGSRVEREFFETATRQLKTRGIIALVCPRKTALRSDIRNLFKTWYDHVSTVAFPDAHRQYNEVVMFGIKRSKMESYWNRENSDVFLDEPHTYAIPTGKGVGNRFVKIQMTEDELEGSLADSPLNEHLKPPVAGQLISPPLELGTGHLALLLASGHLDGLVSPPDEPPHVVRGTARKAQFVKATERKEEKGGMISTKTVIGEKIELVIRVVDSQGEIKTLTQSAAPVAPPQPTAPDPQPTRPQRQEPEPEPTPEVVSQTEPEPVGAGVRDFDVD